MYAGGFIIMLWLKLCYFLSFSRQWEDFYWIYSGRNVDENNNVLLQRKVSNREDALPLINLWASTPDLNWRCLWRSGSQSLAFNQVSSAAFSLLTADVKRKNLHCKSQTPCIFQHISCERLTALSVPLLQQLSNLTSFRKPVNLLFCYPGPWLSGGPQLV